MDFGYVRVSTKDQNPARQIRILMDMGIEERNIYVEKKSGHNFERERYDMLVNHIMRPGDRLTVTELKRFGRNYREIYREWHHITRELGMDIRVADNKILDTSLNKDLLDRLSRMWCWRYCPMWRKATGRNGMSCSARELKQRKKPESIWAGHVWSIRRTGANVMAHGRKGVLLQWKQCAGPGLKRTVSIVW